MAMHQAQTVIEMIDRGWKVHSQDEKFVYMTLKGMKPTSKVDKKGLPRSIIGYRNYK